MRVFLVMYMEAKKLKTVGFPFEVLWCKIAKGGKCSAPLWSFNFFVMLGSGL